MMRKILGIWGYQRRRECDWKKGSLLAAMFDILKELRRRAL
jgi:hypothetical protein